MKVAVVGAGPAGVRAVERLVAAGLSPVWMDEAPDGGGRIYQRPPAPLARDARTLYGFEAKRATAIHDTLDALDPHSTLFIVASKTFSTQETMANAQTARRWLSARRFPVLPSHHSMAFSISPPHSLRAFLQSIMPALVRSRSSLIIWVVIAMCYLYKYSLGSALRVPGLQFS